MMITRRRTDPDALRTIAYKIMAMTNETPPKSASQRAIWEAENQEVLMRASSGLQAAADTLEDMLTQCETLMAIAGKLAR